MSGVTPSFVTIPSRMQGEQCQGSRFGSALRSSTDWGTFMSSERIQQILAILEADVKSKPCAIEFEMAYQVRIAIERIRFAIKHAEQFGNPSGQMREASLQLLDALDRLEAVDRRFQIRSRISRPNGNGHHL
jgi:hypothetical protein